MSQLFWNAIYEKSGRWHGPILYLWVRKKNHAVALWTWIDFFLIELQSHFFNAKVNGFQMAKIRKKKNGKENRDEWKKEQFYG